MVIKDSEWTDYIEPLKKLFPKGEYWDNLLKDESSDVSLVCKARAKTIAEFRRRINQLQRESFPDSADETIGDWERVYFGYENEGLSLEQRRSLLHIQRLGGMNISIARAIADTYGGTILRWEIPYTPAAFGHAQFGASYMSGLRVCGSCLCTPLFLKAQKKVLRLQSGGLCLQTRQYFLYTETRLWQECILRTKK